MKLPDGRARDSGAIPEHIAKEIAFRRQSRGARTSFRHFLLVNSRGAAIFQ